MRAIAFDTYGGPEVLHLESVKEPSAQSGQIAIRVHAVAVNPADALLRAGVLTSYLDGLAVPHIPGWDVAGVVHTVGPDSDGRFRTGDAVVAFAYPFTSSGGSYADVIVVDQRSVVPAPRGLSMVEASTILLNGVTASLAIRALDLAAGESVYVSGGAGAVGGYAIQLAKRQRLTVVADAAPRDKALLESLGADFVIARGGSLHRDVRDRFPDGVDGVVDAANLDGAALPLMGDGAAMATFLEWDGPTERSIRAIPVHSPESRYDTALLEELVWLAERSLITPRVAGVLPAWDAAEAHRLMEAGGVRGRLVLDFTH